MTLNRYDVILADTPDTRRIHHSVRFAVFCEDRKFEDARAYADGLETDQYDEQSAHFVVRDTLTKRWVAAARLILPGESPLQVEKYCPLPASQAGVKSMRIAEVSRLAILRGQQGISEQRIGGELELSSQLGVAAPTEQQHFILASLLRGLAKFGCENNMTHAVFFTTRPLARILARIGVNLWQVGDAIIHRGVRRPYMVGSHQAVQALEGWGQQIPVTCAPVPCAPASRPAYQPVVPLGRFSSPAVSAVA